MWRRAIILLCATGTMALLEESSPPGPSSLVGEGNATRPFVRRFACPVGFFRLKRLCYYLSGGAVPWKEAYFHCRDRNATLAELDRKGKDGTLRRYLFGDQFTKLERWIGGIYNWRLGVWEWGVRGEKMNFQNFARERDARGLAWQCTVLDPTVRYRWTARSCYDRKHYVCQVPAGRIARKRSRTSKARRKGAAGAGRKTKAWPRWSVEQQEQQWSQGLNFGARPPHRSGRQRAGRQRPSNRGTGEQRYDVLQGDGPSNEPQNIVDVSSLVSDYHSRINEIAREEILLRP